jgi:ubiquinone/menaquinone biosynthesis C-methylase UbiE
MNSDNCSAYQALAPIYDVAGLGRQNAEVADRIARLIGGPGRMLDLCCATGLVGLHMEAHGWQVCGVDCAAAMVAIAQARARDAGSSVRFVHADARQLPDDIRRAGPFDLVVCLGDRLAEAMVSEQEGILAQMAGLLSERGALVFDMRRTALLEQWDARDEVLYDDQGVLVYVRRDYAPRTQIATSRFVWFIRDVERWWRGEASIQSWYCSDAQLALALEAAALRIEGRLARDGGPAQADDPWTIYVARREPGAAHG